MPNPNTEPDPKDDPPAIVQFPTPQPDPALGGAVPPPSRAPTAPAAPAAPDATSFGIQGAAVGGSAAPQQMSTQAQPAAPPAAAFATPGAGSASAPDQMAADNMRPGANEARHDFEAQDPNIKGPSDFVGFDRYAGVNDDLMRQIADRDSDKSSAARQTALGFLSDAQNEATADVPVEQTASYKKYLDAMKKTNDAGQSFNAKTGNPYEDALRGVYAPAQTARDNRLQANAVNSGNVSAGNRNRFNTTAKAQADAAAAAAAAKAIADKNTANDTRRSAAGEAASLRQDARDARTDPADKRTGRTEDDEYTTANRRAGSAGRD